MRKCVSPSASAFADKEFADKEMIFLISIVRCSLGNAFPHQEMTLLISNGVSRQGNDFPN
jgi:hypothetical protein